MPDSAPRTAASLDTDLSGRQLGGYRLLRRLGKGAMAEVYLADQMSLGRQVALKVLRSQLATDATYVERFQHEARAAAQLIHANIVQIYEVGRDDGIHFIAQEYLPDELRGTTFYAPGNLGHEKRIAERMAWWRARAEGTKEPGGSGEGA